MGSDMAFCVDQELKNYLPAISAEQYDLLRTAVVREGFRDTFVVWDEENLLVDGHNRNAVYEELLAAGVAVDPPQVRRLSFPDREAVKQWMDENALARRNLHRNEYDYLIGRYYERVKKKLGDNQHTTSVRVPQFEEPSPTSDRVAKQFGCSGATVERNATFAKAVDEIGQKCGPEVKQQILTGQVQVNKADVEKLAALPKEEIRRAVATGKEGVKHAVKHTAKAVDADWSERERALKARVEAGETVVANMGRDHNLIDWAYKKGWLARIDRATEWGNPFVLGDDGGRDQVCDKFAKHYFPHKLKLNQTVRQLKGKVLACHCAPERCHGDHLASLANKVCCED